MLNLIDQSIKNKSALHLIDYSQMAAYTVMKTRYMRLFNCAKIKKSTTLEFMPALDGRDTPQKSAERNLSKLENLWKTGGRHISTISGRFFAMDRDHAGIVS